MAAPKHVEVRCARDRIIDLLGIGETYPVRDVAVQSVQLTVSVDEPAAIKIQPGQEGVRYELCEGETALDPDAYYVDGQGREALLPGPPVTGDRTFRIFARKTGGSGRSAFLLQTATVKVGLDASLDASIKGLPRLHPELVSPPAADPWVAEHGVVVEVLIAKSQPNASYQLAYGGPAGAPITTAPVLSGGGDLSLFTGPVEEDTLIRIRATRTFEPGEGRDDLEAWLDAQLPLAVRADPSPAVSIVGSPLADPSAPLVLTIVESQPSASYVAFARALRDRDFVRGPSPAEPAVAVPVPASLDVPAHEVWVREPPRPDPWKDQPGYVPACAPTPGTGADLALELSPSDEDRALVVKASKAHFVTGFAGGLRVLPGQTELQLEQSLVALARPHPAPPLVLEASPNEGGPGVDMLVSGGQRGVFYHFRSDTKGPELGPPAYFHRLDEDDPRQNRGLGQLEIENDFALARDAAPDPATPDADPALVPPPHPLVGLAPAPEGEVSVMAVKARTGVGWPESRPFTVTTKQGP